MSEKNILKLNGQAKRVLVRSMELILKNLQTNMEFIDDSFNDTQKFIDIAHNGLINKRKFFLLASGRSAMILQCFATRLVHLGAEIYMVSNLGSIPALKKEDLLIVLSGSGTTSIVISLLKDYVKAIKPYKVVAITSHPDAEVGNYADLKIKLIGRTKKDKDQSEDAILTPEGTMFEQVAFTYLDAIIAELAIKLGKTNEDLLRAHAQGV